jgi:hypothetical protein
MRPMTAMDCGRVESPFVGAGTIPAPYLRGARENARVREGFGHPGKLCDHLAWLPKNSTGAYCTA